MSPCWHVSSNRMIRKPIAQFHGSLRSTTLIKRGFILVLKYITFFPTFPWQGLLNYTRKIDNKRTHLWKKTPFGRWAKRYTYKGLEVGAAGWSDFKVAKNVYACSGRNDTWSILGNVIGSEAKTPEMKDVEMKDWSGDRSFVLAVTALQLLATVRDQKLF